MHFGLVLLGIHETGRVYSVSMKNKRVLRFVGRTHANTIFSRSKWTEVTFIQFSPARKGMRVLTAFALVCSIRCLFKGDFFFSFTNSSLFMLLTLGLVLLLILLVTKKGGERSFPRSNSSFLLSNGHASKSSVIRLREDKFLVDTGLGTPKICIKDELTKVPQYRRTAARFENKVGSSFNVVADESTLKRRRNYERFFHDLVAGEPLIKERAAARLNAFLGSLDVAAGEPLVLPRRFSKNRAWRELQKIWRTKKKAKGFIINKVLGGYSVAIAGFITFLPFLKKTFIPLLTKKKGNRSKRRSGFVRVRFTALPSL